MKLLQGVSQSPLQHCAQTTDKDAKQRIHLSGQQNALVAHDQVPRLFETVDRDRESVSTDHDTTTYKNPTIHKGDPIV